MGWLKDLGDSVGDFLRGNPELRHERKMARIEMRKAKQEYKWSAFETAYENGIDPRESGWVGASQMVGSVASAASNIYGFGFKPGDRDNNAAAYKGTGIFGQSQGMPIYVVIGIFLLLIFAFKKQK